MSCELKIWCQGHFEVIHKEFVFGKILHQRKQEILAEYLNTHYADWKEALLIISTETKNGQRQYNRIHVERCTRQ